MTTTHKPNYNPLKNETDIYGLPLSSAVDKLEGKSKKSLCEKIQTNYDLPNWTCDRIPRENKYVIKISGIWETSSKIGLTYKILEL